MPLVYNQQDPILARLKPLKRKFKVDQNKLISQKEPRTTSQHTPRKKMKLPASYLIVPGLLNNKVPPLIRIT